MWTIKVFDKNTDELIEEFPVQLRMGAHLKPILGELLVGKSDNSEAYLSWEIE